MSQNIYDDLQFFTGYAIFDCSVKGLDSTPEWLSLQTMLPSITGLRMMDLGCGYGRSRRWAQQQGASQITDFDIPQHTLAQARKVTRGDKTVCCCVGLQTLTLPANSCDLIYSLLASHYLPGVASLFAILQQALVPSGTLVFSVKHSIYTTPLQQGWRVDGQGQKS